MEELGKNYIDNNEEVEITYTPSYNENIDTVPPVINIKQKTYKIRANQRVNFLKDVTASDSVDGDLTNKINSNIDELDFSKSGIKKIEYSVSDSSGNIAYETVYVTVKKDNTKIIRFGQIGILLIVLCIFALLDKYIRGLKLEKRFSKYTINSSKNKLVSLFDSLDRQYTDFVNKISKSLYKSVLLKKRAKKYERYITAFNIKDSMNFIAKKIIVGFVFVIFLIIIELLQSRLANSLQMLAAFIVGFYALDLLYLYRYNKYRKRLENDLLDAITIMNNAFKAGMSITQAINLVAIEVKGPISKEFKHINEEINMGLDIEVAFKRFSSRIKTEEAIYLTSSLSVLNKTGGNIIKVFDSIEKNMFNRRKLENELKSLTSSSKLVMTILIIVPPSFIVFIGIINKEYFIPLLNNILGIILLIIMNLIYATYIIVVRKVLKVRGIR